MGLEQVAGVEISPLEKKLAEAKEHANALIRSNDKPNPLASTVIRQARDRVVLFERYIAAVRREMREGMSRLNERDLIDVRKECGQSFPKSISYPLALSRVRSESSRHGMGSRPVRCLSAPPSHGNIPLASQQNPNAIDVLPSYSGATSAVADVILEKMLRTIIRDDIRAVGIFGTDVRDKLFLAQQHPAACSGCAVVHNGSRFVVYPFRFYELDRRHARRIHLPYVSEKPRLGATRRERSWPGQ